MIQNRRSSSTHRLERIELSDEVIQRQSSQHLINASLR